MKNIGVNQNKVDDLILEKNELVSKERTNEGVKEEVSNSKNNDQVKYYFRLLAFQICLAMHFENCLNEGV
jgi:hypothetical protein